jgi:hypothetical protein
MCIKIMLLFVVGRVPACILEAKTEKWTITPEYETTSLQDTLLYFKQE